MQVHMKRFILTGTPGSGKTSLIRALEMQGHFVIEEAATDVIAHEQHMGNLEPWMHPHFIDSIIALQSQRQIQTSCSETKLQFYDRSPLCTYALAVYLNYEPSSNLKAELERIKRENIYEKRVFFIDNLGFCTPTEARKITFEQSLVFEKIHLETYEKFGYECVKIPVVPLNERVEFLLSLL